jgi:hypothetical protein
VARFEREARVLAALNHPNIATIYGVEDGADVRAFIMELVDGETLADRLARGPVPLAEALPLARQIADPLDAAHEKGIVHRDLKPANIQGDARWHGQGCWISGSQRPWSTRRRRCLGGTDRDGARDPRGCDSRHGRLHESGAGARPGRGQADRYLGVRLCTLRAAHRAPSVAGDTISDRLAAVLDRKPDWTRLPAGAPPGIRRLLRRCLEKEAKRRLRDIGDARLEKVIVTDGPDARRERAALVQALRLLPKYPWRVAVIDAEAARPEVRPSLRRLDAFTTTGGRVVYILRHSVLLRGAMAGSRFHVHALASVIWHEMAHIGGGNEAQARRAEEDLWTRFIRDGQVDPVVGLRYLSALKGRPHDELLALR